MNRVEYDIECIRHCLSKAQIAEYLCISRESYWRKVNGKAHFTDSEKVRLAELLSLSRERFCEIFFPEVFQ